MSRTAWRIATDTPTYETTDLSGAGAKATGGRWNAPGISVVYASTTRALACLETIVHLNAGGLPLNRYLVALAIPDEVWDRAHGPGVADIGWDAEPSGLVSIDYGTDWVRSGRSAVLLVPSVIVPEELNVLLNSAHADCGLVRATKVRRWLYDPRLNRP